MSGQILFISRQDLALEYQLICLSFWLNDLNIYIYIFMRALLSHDSHHVGLSDCKYIFILKIL